MIRILEGDCREVMATLDAGSVDAIVCDPPYELGFMGKGWDATGVANDPETWRAALRVLKPGGHLLAFSGTRTYHRMVCAIEDAGFEIRDQIGWVYGSGFPKSLDVSKAIDKARRRDYVLAAVALGVALPGRSVDDWTKEDHAPGDKWWELFKASLASETWQAIERAVVGRGKSGDTAWFAKGAHDLTAPATDAARQWQGWGTALKPAWEPIVLARKPLVSTVAANVLQHGTGALNIDGCRVEHQSEADRASATPQGKATAKSGALAGKVQHEGEREEFARPDTSLGRWPANIIHDGSDEVLAAFPDAPGQQRATGPEFDRKAQVYGKFAGVTAHTPRGDSGSAARFFYTAKASAHDRNDGTYDLPQRVISTWGGDEDDLSAGKKSTKAKGNHHPTVKPTDLMRYLCRLVTPAIVWYCPSCEGGHSDSTKTAASVTSLRDVWGEVQAQRQPESGAVLQPAVCRQGDGVAAEAVRAMRAELQANLVGEREAAESVLQSSLCLEGVGPVEAQSERPHQHEGVHPDPRPGSPNGESGGLRHGASTRHGEEARSDADGERDRASHQRGQGGQPAGELGVDAEDDTRPAAEAEAQADPMPTLPRVDRSQRTCPTCEGTLATRAGVVLDPFMGSGSTLKAAELEGFSAIGIELDPAYIEIARRRIASDAPLFAEVA